MAPFSTSFLPFTIDFVSFISLSIILSSILPLSLSCKITCFSFIKLLTFVTSSISGIEVLEISSYFMETSSKFLRFKSDILTTAGGFLSSSSLLDIDSGEVERGSEEVEIRTDGGEEGEGGDGG